MAVYIPLLMSSMLVEHTCKTFPYCKTSSKVKTRAIHAAIVNANTMVALKVHTTNLKVGISHPQNAYYVEIGKQPKHTLYVYTIVQSMQMQDYRV